MRFDDRLNTVLAQPAANAHDRAVRWRQLVELLARADDLSSPSAQLALVQVRSDADQIDPQLRAAAARAVARPELPVELVAAFAADSISVSAPVLTAVALSPAKWTRVLDEASPESLRFIRSLYPELNAWPVEADRADVVEAEIEDISEDADYQFAPAVDVEPSVEAEPEPEPEPEPEVGSSRVDLQACKLEYSIVSPK